MKILEKMGCFVVSRVDLSPRVLLCRENRLRSSDRFENGLLEGYGFNERPSLNQVHSDSSPHSLKREGLFICSCQNSIAGFDRDIDRQVYQVIVREDYGARCIMRVLVLRENT